MSGPLPSSPLAVVTVVAGNFAAFARVLVDSLRAWHPDLPVYAVFSDPPPPDFPPASEGCVTLPISALEMPDLRRMAFLHTRRELAIAAKPSALLHLLDRGHRTAVFLDADILVLGSLDPLFALASAHAITLTPHLLQPPAGVDRLARELAILRSGIYNGGVVGVTDRPESRAFLAWWAARLAARCVHDPDRGLHYDQRWLDFAPSFVDDLAVARHAGLNVAYWNQRERQMRVEGGEWVVDGDIGRFFHFSGFDPLDPERITQYYPDLGRDSVGPAAPLFDDYTERLLAAGHVAAQASAYVYDRFDNGVRIPNVARRLMARLDGAAIRFGDPFASGPGSFQAWLMGPDERSGLARLWQAVYDSRPDLQSAFPDPGGADRVAFLAWVRQSGLVEHAVDGALTPAAE